jgi:hypothetical protein
LKKEKQKKMNKKIMSLAALMIMTGLLISLPVASAATPQNGIIQGKITDTGILFIVLEKTPLLNKYSTIQSPAHDQNFLIAVYNPNPTESLTIAIATWGGTHNGTLSNPTWQNITMQAASRQMTQLTFSAQFTAQQENMTIQIQGTGYQFLEQRTASPAFPFYASGELGFFAFVSLMTGAGILFAFGLALVLLRRAKYFPKIQGIKLLFLTLALTGILTTEAVQNYYAIITTQWYYWEMPIIALSLLIFMSYIPPHIKRGILLKFLADHSKGEAYTEIIPILTADTEIQTAPEGFRDAGMEYIDRRSYLQFLYRLAGKHTPILFLDGTLPDQMAEPRKRTGYRNENIRLLARFRNRKRDSTDYDYGYLIANEGEIEIMKKESTTKTGKAKKKPYMIIPLSGHHSSYIEDFLAGIKDSWIKGEKITEYKEKNALLKTGIASGTYLNDQSIIDEIGAMLDLNTAKEQPKPREEKESKQDNTETIEGDKQ